MTQALEDGIDYPNPHALGLHAAAGDPAPLSIALYAYGAMVRARVDLERATSAVMAAVRDLSAEQVAAFDERTTVYEHALDAAGWPSNTG